ncbi:Glutamate--tRNA ligase, chloroplastic/mitochondrial [Gracilariopsis chorda]|uniref:glutamate--tRNA ligase n=1 Tax=Gracilariopsis chorda TaxID=448386 RepID=A0A2V3IPR9_9FLOR|nr:Glutamate--tRNA ligase, chloroplastic/mitochondrial [Gracilariopsis chorda]|eukprot:PXF44068.1 Glutamate--tRNA ligase, chloroplastic/mitochondrial [Gracilariopsis chorda]
MAFASTSFLAPLRTRTVLLAPLRSTITHRPNLRRAGLSPIARAAAPARTVRVRFAPSPTGALHVGGARTALYNWLLARQQKGHFVLRVEDTDLARSTRESEEMVLRDLRWLGLTWDEGPDVGGVCSPYRQSERGECYKQFARKLIKEGKAYPCFCTEEELEQKRLEAEAQGRPPQYDGTWRDANPDEVKMRLERGDEYTIRFRVPEGSRVVIDDAVRGKVAWDANSTVGDFILLRSNGVPVYNFCVAVDDALMGISTVIRAEEHLTNTLRQVLILRALDFEPPQYAHCSLILGADRSKLSKRHGAASVTQFREEGYLPVAMVNYLATLGWNDGTEKEIYSVEELVEAFDINRITKSAAMFDKDKLRFINGQHLRALPQEEIETLVIDEWKRSGVFTDVIQPSAPLGSTATALVRGSLELVNDANAEILSALSYPLQETIASGEADELIAEDGGFAELASIALRDYDAGVMPIGNDDDHATQWKEWLTTVRKETKRKGKRLFHPLRLALTGKMSGPDVGQIIRVLHLTEESDASPSLVPLSKRIETLRSKVASM